MIWLLSIPLAAVVGAWAHELTHALVATVLGGRVVRIDLWEMFVEFEGLGSLRAQAVRVAPLAVGLASLPVVLSVPERAMPAALMGWFVYSLLGGEGEPGII
jgi:hypothetical protein